MFLDKDRYLILKEWQDFGINAIYTKKNYGNVMEISKEKFNQDFSFENKKIVAGHQTHSDNVAVIENLDKVYFENTDGFITDREDVVIFTKYADCLPIYFYDMKKRVFGLAHSGWQGSYKEIGKKVIHLMQNHYKSDIKDISIAFGIGISQENYEVGKDFLEKFKNKFSKELVEKSFKYKGEKIYFDNQSFVYWNMLEAGLRKENILTNNLCTYNGEFHSYRRDRENSGRNGAFICIKK
jgi:YfiH family protein